MLFKRKNRVEVVPESEWTDYGDQYVTKKGLALAACVPAVGSVALVAQRFMTESAPQVIAASATPIAPVATPAMPMPTVSPIGDPTGFVADKSLEMLATVLNPVIDILVAISFPIASVIMVGACFFFMIGNSEKAWSMIMNAGLGYVLVQLSPLFLEILRKVGETV